MATIKRSFTADDTPVKSADYHGGASYERTQPDVASEGVESINVFFTFQEALKLSLAVQSCVLNVNKYNRSTKAGRNVGLLLSFKTKTKTVTVITSPVSSSKAHQSQGHS
jgi:hypothetical protein